MMSHRPWWFRLASWELAFGSLLVVACADEDLSGVPPAPRVSDSAGAAVPSPTPTPVAVHYVCDGGKTFDAYVFPVPARRAIVGVDGRTLDEITILVIGPE